MSHQKTENQPTVRQMCLPWRLTVDRNDGRNNYVYWFHTTVSRCGLYTSFVRLALLPPDRTEFQVLKFEIIRERKTLDYRLRCAGTTVKTTRIFVRIAISHRRSRLVSTVHTPLYKTYLDRCLATNVWSLNMCSLIPALFHLLFLACVNGIK